MGRTAKGLPLGIQVVGRRMHEHDLLKCAGIIAQ
jgi:amidase